MLSLALSLTVEVAVKHALKCEVTNFRSVIATNLHHYPVKYDVLTTRRQAGTLQNGMGC